MTWTRRGLLKGVGAVAAAGLIARTRAVADPTRALDPIELNCATYKILEIYLSGGLSHRETMWVEQPDASPVWRNMAYITPSRWNTDVSSTTTLPSAGWTFPVTGNVHLGPCALPMNGHALGNQVRVVATHHPLFPHEGGGALALTGLTPGRTRGAGLGTVIQRRWGSASNPVSFTIVRESFYGGLMSEVGVHSSAHAPIVLRMPNDLVSLLTRPGITASDLAALNTGLQYYEDRYKGRLDYPGAGPARSIGHDAYATSLRRLIDSPTLQARLAAGPSMGWFPENHLTGQTFGRRSIEMAAYLLNTGARYVGVIDHGLVYGFDTHFYPTAPSTDEHVLNANRGLFHLLHELREQVDAGTLNLSNTLIVIHSEFGRTRDDPANATGTNHWPLGYASLLIGGPLVGKTQTGSLDFTPMAGNHGGIAAGGPSGDGFTPTDVRAGLLYAAGIDPFDPDCLLVDETSMNTTSESVARQRIKQDLLGITTSVACPTLPDPSASVVL